MLSIKKILCPVDFSDFSRNAFDRAVAIARQHQATVTALHIVPVYSTASFLPYAGAAGAYSFAPPEIDRQQVKQDLERFLGLDESPGAPVTCEVGEAPDVPWEILAHADRLPAALIVMGTHGRSGFRRLLFGSVTEKVLRSAGQPVLTVPSGAPQAVPIGSAPFRQILCATDFSECSVAALRYATSLAEHPDARLTVLHVVEILPPAYSPAMAPSIDLVGFQMILEKAGREGLHRAISETMRQACTIEEIITTGKPHREILRIAEEQQSDLIVLGIHGGGAIDRLMFGSTTEPVVRRATCPVLIVRPTPNAAAAAA